MPALGFGNYGGRVLIILYGEPALLAEDAIFSLILTEPTSHRGGSFLI